MTEKNKERRPIVAAFLSFISMGLGQLYNGQFRRAAVFYAIEIFAVVVVATVSTLLLSFQGIMILYVSVLIFVGIRVIAVVDAILGARRIGAVALQRYNRWYVYLSVFLMTMVFQFVFENPVTSNSIPTGSMLPTLLRGDYVYSNKNAYHDRAPKRGDVAIFKPRRDNETVYIARVIGLPGDRVQMTDGVLHINRKPVERKRIADYIDEDQLGNKRPVIRYLETLPNGVSYRTLDLKASGFLDNTREYVVPDGHYFLMGDNRDNASDSRMLSNVGYVPAANLVSRADVLYFSHNGAASWWQIWRWRQAIRFGRIGKVL